MQGRSLAILAVLWLLFAVSATMAAENLSIHLEVGGGLDVWLNGLSFAATIDGDADLVGDVPCNDGMVWISAVGSITGTGWHNLLELTTSGWILMTAIGSTPGDNDVVFRSLFYASHQSLVPLQAGDSFEGVHHTVIQIGDTVAVYGGEATGTIVGGLAPAETEGTIRLAGSGSFHLLGFRIPEARADEYPGCIPLDDPNLTDAFLQTIDAFFNVPMSANPDSASRVP